MAHYGSAASPTAPKAPEIKLTLHFPEKAEDSLQIRAIADTGAAKTCLPKWVLDKLTPYGITSRPGRVRGPVGPATRTRLYFVDLRVLDCDFDAHEVGIIERDYAIIGRDILNEYYVTFEGPKETWFVEKQNSRGIR